MAATCSSHSILKRYRERREYRTLVKKCYFFIDDLFSSRSSPSPLHVPLLTTLFQKDNKRERGRDDVPYRKQKRTSKEEEKEEEKKPERERENTRLIELVLFLFFFPIFLFHPPTFNYITRGPL